MGFPFSRQEMYPTRHTQTYLQQPIVVSAKHVGGEAAASDRGCGSEEKRGGKTGRRREQRTEKLEQGKNKWRRRKEREENE